MLLRAFAHLRQGGDAVLAGLRTLLTCEPCDRLLMQDYDPRSKMRQYYRILASSSSFEDLNTRVTDQLAVARLHSEFLELFLQNNVPANSFSSKEEWPQVYAGMLDQIRGKPLTFPKKTKWAQWLRDSAAEVRTELAGASQGFQGVWISRFFVEVGGKPGEVVGSLMWHLVDESKQVVFLAPVRLSEYRRPGKQT
jgi:hypothetical protein